MITDKFNDILHHFRYEDQDRLLWLDFLCIDQNNLDERASQVGLMREIYRRASEVLIWLGKSSPNSSAAISFLRETGEYITHIRSSEGVAVNALRVHYLRIVNT